MSISITDITEIKSAAIEELEDINLLANGRILRILQSGIRNDSQVGLYQWFLRVAHETDRELKERGARAKNSWEELYDSCNCDKCMESDKRIPSNLKLYLNARYGKEVVNI